MRLFPRFFLCFICLCVVGFGFDARAQNTQPKEAPGPITMEVASPLALTEMPLLLAARKGRWLPVAITLTNSGEPVKGTLSLQLSTATDPDRNPPRFFTEVDLPTNARKRVWLYGRVERDDTDKFEISFQGRGFKAMGTDGIVQVTGSETRLVLTISDSDEKLSYLKGLKGPGLGILDENQSTPSLPQGSPGAPNSRGNLNASAIQPLGATHDFIPSRWVGLDAFDMVVLQDFPHTSLTPLQIAALKGYAAGGGALLALGGANWQRLASSPLAAMWPIVPQSSDAAASKDVNLLVNRFARFPAMTGADRLGGAPVVATKGVLRPGARVLIGSSGAPILAVNDFGAGQVLFLSVDPTQPPFLGWRGHARMWADIFRPTSRPTQIATVGEKNVDENQYRYSGYAPPVTSSTDGLLEALKTSKQLKTPPVSVIAWFLALYVFFLVPVNYILLRFFDRRELAWLTIPIIVLAFSVMSYAAALRIKGTAILTRQVNIIQTSDGSNLARGDAMLWLFSPKKTTYDISSKDPQMVVGDYLSDQNVGVSIRQPEENQAFALDRAAINMWDWRSFVGHSTTDLKGGVRAVVQGSARNAKVGIQNDSPFDLKGVVLVCDGRVLSFKTVKAGSTSFNSSSDNVRLSNAQIAGRIRSASRLESELPGNQVGGFETIPDKLLAAANAGKGSTPSTAIFAWSDKPFAGLTIGREDARAQNLTLLVVRIENDASLRAALNRGRKEKTSNKARVKKLSVELLPLDQKKQAGAITTFEAILPSAKAARVVLHMTLAFENQYGYQYGYGETTEKTAKASTVEVFDYSAGVWRAVAARDMQAEKAAALKAGKGKPEPGPDISKQKSDSNNASSQKGQLIATLSSSLARNAVQQPDRRIQFRVRTYHDDLRVKEALVIAW